MLIKYNGQKKMKTLEYPHKDWGIKKYVWDEFDNYICDVDDSSFAKFLLHPDKKGLFSMVRERPEQKDETPVKRGRKKKGENESIDK